MVGLFLSILRFDASKPRFPKQKLVKSESTRPASLPKAVTVGPGDSSIYPKEKWSWME